MVTNSEVIQDFTNNQQNATQNLYSKRDYNGRLILYSYGEHFPMCIKLEDCLIINSSSYSMTTAKHKGLLSRALNYNGFKDLVKNHKEDIILMNTEKIKNVTYLNAKNKAELTEFNI